MHLTLDLPTPMPSWPVGRERSDLYKLRRLLWRPRSIATRNKKLLVAPGAHTSSKKLCQVANGFTGKSGANLVPTRVNGKVILSNLFVPRIPTAFCRLLELYGIGSSGRAYVQALQARKRSSELSGMQIRESPTLQGFNSWCPTNSPVFHIFPSPKGELVKEHARTWMNVAVLPGFWCAKELHSGVLQRVSSSWFLSACSSSDISI